MNKELIKKWAIKINGIAKERAMNHLEDSVDNVIYCEIAFIAAGIITECDDEVELNKRTKYEEVYEDI